MITWTGFCLYFSENQKRLPASLSAEIKRTALNRYKERLQAGRADSPLLFDDLISRCEKALGA